MATLQLAGALSTSATLSGHISSLSAAPSAPRQRLALWRRQHQGQERRGALAAASRVTVQAVFDVTTLDVTQVKPQGDRLLVKLEKLQETSAGGVLLPSSAVKFDRFLTGVVLAAGAEAKSAAPGQKVMFSDLNGYEVDLGSRDEKHCFVRDADLLAVVE